MCEIHYQLCDYSKKHTKPIKPKLSVQIASESDNSKTQVDQIPIVGANSCDENVAYIAYGSDLILSFEKLVFISDHLSYINLTLKLF